jgi:hypothetical protein
MENRKKQNTRSKEKDRKGETYVDEKNKMQKKNKN